MADDVQRLLDAFEDMRGQANVNACFGEPVEDDGHTVIPVAKVKHGFCMGVEQAVGGQEGPGGREAPAEGTAGPYGGGVMSSPVGVIEITEGRACFRPIIDEQKLAIMRILVAAWGAFWLARVLSALFGRKD